MTSIHVPSDALRSAGHGRTGSSSVRLGDAPEFALRSKNGHELYNRYLDELELAAELDLDGVAVNEHHQNAYGLMPSLVVWRRVGAATEKPWGRYSRQRIRLREHPLTWRKNTR